MYGRFAHSMDPKKLAKAFGVAKATNVELRYNITLSQDFPRCRIDQTGGFKFRMKCGSI